MRAARACIDGHGATTLIAAYLNRHEQIVSGHLLRLRQSKQKQKSRRDVGQNSVFARENCCGIFGHVNEMHKVARVRGVGRAIRIAHLLAIAVVGGDDGICRQAREVSE